MVPRLSSLQAAFIELSLAALLWALACPPDIFAESQSEKDKPADPYGVALPDQLSSPIALPAATTPVAAESKSPSLPPARPRPYRPVFYDNDFRYLDQPDNPWQDPFDVFKRLRPIAACDLVTDIGGEFRWQGKVENNRRLNGNNNTYNLFRERLYADTWYADVIRFYVEGIDASSANEDEPPLVIDENRWDLLNIFGEVLLWTDGEHAVSVRYGRQELLFGEQRLISPLDWGNTRRTFDETVRVLWRASRYSLDFFWGRPVIPDVNNFDHGDQSRQFGGLYASFKPRPEWVYDAYFLALLESDDLVPGRRIPFGDFEVYTLGGRWKGTWQDWLGEIEAAVQWGHQADLDRIAGMFTIGAGRRFPSCCAKPELWIYFDWASGDDDPNDGRFNTFNQLFPLAHKYFGFLDIVARQNIRDLNILLTMTPLEKVRLLAWYHRFWLEEERDGLYNAAGVLIRRDPTGRAGTDVGHELDLVLEILVNPHTDWQFGYSHFAPGNFIKRTGVGGDAEFFYTQFVFRF
ncbi:MAG: alginate export family protein [Gemmataceae bacterium]